MWKHLTVKLLDKVYIGLYSQCSNSIIREKKTHAISNSCDHLIEFPCAFLSFPLVFVQIVPSQWSLLDHPIFWVCLFCLGFFLLHGETCGMSVSQPGIKPSSFQRKCRVLATELPGKSWELHFKLKLPSHIPYSLLYLFPSHVIIHHVRYWVYSLPPTPARMYNVHPMREGSLSLLFLLYHKSLQQCLTFNRCRCSINVHWEGKSIV